MKASAAQIRAALAKPGPDIRLYLLHGPDEAGAADLIQAYEARIAALERLVGKQALELEFLRGHRQVQRARETRLHP